MSGLSFQEIADTVGVAAKRAEDRLLEKLEEFASNDDITSGDLLMMQAEMQRWNFSHELCAKNNEKLGNTFASIVQKT
ncbi:hypothetical protein [Pandoraea sputorum]|uniref:hypothetical protein n=1 Tax=Pandoraea sputorum TaxID=93222 RepID=UPI002AF6B2EC|nr:hypothetical protein [Pandoraea sputorum]